MGFIVSCLYTNSISYPKKTRLFNYKEQCPILTHKHLEFL